MTLLALDWGTSSLRGALLAADGTVMAERSFARGILTVEKGGFAALFDSLFGDWMQPDTLCLIAGMAGSQQGWLEAPYCPCPAGFAEIAAGLVWVEHNRIAIVPGLRIEKQGIPDVMRGEETQVFGALQQLGLRDARMVLPGTHSKWVTVTDCRVTDFSTWMTGEFYALLRARTPSWHAHCPPMTQSRSPHWTAPHLSGVWRRPCKVMACCTPPSAPEPCHCLNAWLKKRCRATYPGW